ncbi:MAG: hypothetical protein ACTFAL_02675 [Candidatus Electronema sp. V4]|uniref:hypothetical protein n=1 Tax=Candidatus Electronema sp. V4 TaxID=3454756 RepID=UPI0040554233
MPRILTGRRAEITQVFGGLKVCQAVAQVADELLDVPDEVLHVQNEILKVQNEISHEPRRVRNNAAGGPYQPGAV